MFSSGEGNVFLWIRKRHTPGSISYKYYSGLNSKTYPLIINPTGFNYFDKSEQPIWTMQDAYESQSIYGITACHCCIRTLNTEGGIDI